MDSLGGEVIVKVKEAIREKLKEMNANSSDEIIDYIMLLVTTKKSSAELAKSIDFVMENNTSIFVKWLSTIIKKLQQVTVSTSEKYVSEKLQVSKDNITANGKDQGDDTLICETNDVKFDDSDEEKELVFNLNMENKSIKIANGENKEKSFELNELKLKKPDENKILSQVKVNERKPRICISPKKVIGTKSIIGISKKISCNKSVHEMKNTFIKCNSNNINSGDVPKNNISGDNEKNDVKRKRPRISINSDDEEEKNSRIKIPITIKEPAKQIAKELPKKNNKISMSQVIVKPTESKKVICKTKEKLLMHDLIVQRIDHQRGALALDTAFKYIQQQIGASDKEIAVVKKWRDYAIKMLRSNKKV